eukprot:gnl/Spiro4/12533_TR6627_c0_g1_i1.p1 gnl/Spiro4/12533_TR6627_c0_g1~~gnl/Spiro4/12533_TR6627_c0_g1_i1.p1  ORF type:complete len:549 (-),score=117.13 gnl/Spiro4/12533_TR6627_c0_g1_i1:123-1769(-)
MPNVAGTVVLLLLFPFAVLTQETSRTRTSVIANNSQVCSYVLDEDGNKEVTCGDEVFGPHDEIPAGSKMFWVYIIVILFLVCFAGLMSGLTLGLMSIDENNLEILAETGKDEEREHARKIKPVLSNRHLLLVTLLLSNAAAMEALPIFLDRLVSPVAALLMSVTLVLIFGEVIPQALCVRYGLAIGAKSAWFVQGLIYVTYIISYPFSLLLDCVIGTNHAHLYRREELGHLVAMHGRHEHENEQPLTGREIKIIDGALKMKQRTTQEIMTPKNDTFMLDSHSVLNEMTLDLILKSGRSRIPIYNRDNDSTNKIVGILLAKMLVLTNPTDGTMIKKSPALRRVVTFVSGSLPVSNLLDLLLKRKCHLALVFDPNECTKIVGIVTLEDVLEELIQQEIEDETDPQESSPEMTEFRVKRNEQMLYVTRLRKYLESNEDEATWRFIHQNSEARSHAREHSAHPGTGTRSDWRGSANYMRSQSSRDLHCSWDARTSPPPTARSASPTPTQKEPTDRPLPDFGMNSTLPLSGSTEVRDESKTPFLRQSVSTPKL